MAGIFSVERVIGSKKGKNNVTIIKKKTKALMLSKNNKFPVKNKTYKVFIGLLIQKTLNHSVVTDSVNRINFFL